MKKFKWIMILPVLLLLQSCLDDLEITPKDDDDFTSEMFYQNPDSYKQFLAKIYGGLSLTGQANVAGDSDLGTGAGTVDEGFSQYLRGWWQLQELTTDEAIIAWGESDNPTIRDLNFNTWNADNVFAEAFFARIFFQIGMCNEFLRETTDEKLDGRGVSGELRAQITTFRAEVRFLRALSYYHGIDTFGKLPFATDADLLGTRPQMQTRAYVFDYVLAELNAIEGSLAAPRSNEYGRADRAAAWMLKAKVLLNAEVYTGSARDADALTAVNQVIGSGYSVAAIPFANLFKADNNSNGAQNEIIFPITQDGIKTRSYGGTTYLIHASCDNNVGATLGIDFGWQGFRVRQEFVSLVGTADPRIMFVPSNSDPASISNYLDFTQGRKLMKFSNKTSTGANGQDATFPDTDFPLFRMGDAYLMYAELAAKGVADVGTAVQYINDLRTRGGVPQLINAGDLNLDLVLAERSRELYWEGYRRQDLIRFNKYTTGYTWQWKGGAQSGVNLPEYRKLFAIPNKELNSNPNLSQNPGY